MSDRPEITQQQIRGRASGQSFSRGKNYYNSGAVTNTIRRGNEIEARCQGSYVVPYRVWARLDMSGITATGCNCEYDWGGDCKHIIAMLLHYLNSPDEFEERQTLNEALLERSKEDLVDIITLMIIRYPDLQDIVDNPTPNEIATSAVLIDTLNFRQNLRDAFGGYDYDDFYHGYDAHPNPIGNTINQTLMTADRLAEREDWLNAASIYRAILEEFAEMDMGYFDPEDDNVYIGLDLAAQGLDKCLAEPVVNENESERIAILEALLGVFIWDVDYGGIGISDGIPEIILKHIQRKDIPSIRKLVEDAGGLKSIQPYSDWSTEVYHSFLNDLDLLDEVEPEVILERLRTHEMYNLLVNKLLEIDRLDEAVTVIQEKMNASHERIQALSLLVRHNHTVRALRIAEDILSNQYDYRLADWLLERYKISGNQEGMFRWQKRQMTELPNLQNYIELKTITQSLNQWGTVRPEIIRDLENSGEYQVLTRIYLYDNEWAHAWDSFPKVKHESYYGNLYPHALELEVAEASCHAMPERAIPVLIKCARQYIDSRGRENYRLAAGLLVKVQQAYDQMDEFETWETLIAEIREQNKRLRALKDELNKAGL